MDRRRLTSIIVLAAVVIVVGLLAFLNNTGEEEDAVAVAPSQSADESVVPPEEAATAVSEAPVAESEGPPAVAVIEPAAPEEAAPREAAGPSEEVAERGPDLDAADEFTVEVVGGEPTADEATPTDRTSVTVIAPADRPTDAAPPADVGDLADDATQVADLPSRETDAEPVAGGGPSRSIDVRPGTDPEAAEDAAETRQVAALPDTDAGAPEAAPETGAEAPEAVAAVPLTPEPAPMVVPTFDVVRVEPDGAWVQGRRATEPARAP